ncbi:Zinc finger CCCH domain-containing protein 5 [Bienertia sinuspersici]
MKEREEEEARLNDPEEQMKLARLQQEEAERMERDRIEFVEREKQFLQALELKKRQEEEEEERRRVLEESQKELVNNENAKEENEDDDWEYVEEGPAEIIWKGNEIIVKKKKVRVPKKSLDNQKEKQESERPISNPLAPQSEAVEDHRSAQNVLESFSHQVPNFGTEQDKEHCPFHLKTGACRFGLQCSRVHFYPDKACTLLLKNMYHGPGLAWEQDEGLEYTEEEADRSFEDFYEDVHTEFLKFGEIVNFKVCKNGSSHLRGNVYVHYKSLESAMLAYQSINGRYFAGKQLTCEYVNVTRWRVAICGEYMKSRLKLYSPKQTCSRGSACNFIHCFRNPGGDYEWADWDKPAPRYWLKRMAALFGYNDDRFTDEVSPGSYHSRRSRSRGVGSPQRKSYSNEDDGHKRRSLWRHRDDDRETYNLAEEMHGRKDMHQDYWCINQRETDNGDILNGSTDDERSFVGMKRSVGKRGRELDSKKQDSRSGKYYTISAKNESTDRVSDRYLERKIRSSSRQKRAAESVHEYHQIRHKKDEKYDHWKTTYTDQYHDRFHKHKGKHVSQETTKADSSKIDSHSDILESEEDKHHSRRKKKFRRIENETECSSSASDESRLGTHGRIKERKEKNRRKCSRSKGERSVAEIEGDEDILECDEDRHHNRGEKSSRLVNDGIGRFGREETRARKSSSQKYQPTTETGSDRDKARHHRHSKKHSRRTENYASSSDSSFEGDKRGRYENRPQKRERAISRSKNESESADPDRSRERIDSRERRHGQRSTDKHHIREPIYTADNRSSGDKLGEKGEAGAGKSDTVFSCRSLRADLEQSHPEQENADDRYCGTSDPTAGSYIMNP